MKIILLLLMAWNAQAATRSAVPLCWQEYQGGIADGRFLVSMETSLLTKEQILLSLSVANGGHLLAQRFPMQFGGTMVISTQASDPSSRLGRQDLIQAVTSQLDALAVLPGVKISCDSLGIGI